jgi:predicted alpha/beta superfamily hydrolase
VARLDEVLMIRQSFCCAALLAWAVAAPALAQPVPSVRVVSVTPYAPAGTQQLVVHSERLGRDFVIVVSAPPAGPAIAAGQKLPAIYALDGGYGIAGPLAQMMEWAFMMSPAYVVSVDYPPGQHDQRDTDLLHRATVRDGAAIGGGGAAFQAFLTQDLRPLLEARYPLDPAKAILFGHSYGGLFAANVLAGAPESFSGYVIASPSVPADPQVVAGVAAVAAKGRGRRVFVAAGGNEGADMDHPGGGGILDGAGRIAAALAAPNSTFTVKEQVFAGESHISYYPQLVPAAFAWILPPGGASSSAPPVAHVAIVVAPEALERLVGVYAIGDGRVVTVTRKDAMLFAGMTGYPGGRVLPETPERFFVPGFDVLMTFVVGASGPASAVVVRINGAEFRAVRSR